MNIRNPFNWNLRFGTIPSEFKEAMTYEEQVMWLYYQIKELKQGSANYNYDLLENKPSIDGVILQGNVTKTQLGIEQNYNILANKPLINSVPLIGNLSLNELGIQGRLIAGSGIRISGNTISAIGGGSGTSDYEQLENLPAINGNELIGDKTSLELGLQESLAVDYSQYARQGKKYNMTNIQIGDTIQTPLTFQNQADCDCIVIENKVAGMKFDLYGIYEVLITNSNNEVVSIYSTGLEPEHGYAEALSDGGYIIMNFDNQLYRCNLLFTSNYVENLLENTKPKELNNDIVLLDGGIIDMDSGFYYFDENHALYFHSATAENSIYKSNDGIFYFDFNSQTFYLDNKIYYYDNTEMDWLIMEHSNITNEIVNSRGKIPTSQAVYNALQNISGNSFYTEIDSDITLNADGTITPSLTAGYYFLKSPHSITYYDNATSSTTYAFTDSIFYYDGEDNIKRTGINTRFTNQIETRFIYSSGTNSWELDEEDDSNFVRNLTGTQSYLRSSIPATGDDNNVANIEAIRNYVKTNYIELHLQSSFNNIPANTYETIPVVTSSTASGISLSNSKIIFSKAMKIKINGNCNPETKTAGSHFFAAIHYDSNDTNLGSIRFSQYAPSVSPSCGIYIGMCDAIIDVNENDYILLKYYTPGSGDVIDTTRFSATITEIK